MTEDDLFDALEGDLDEALVAPARPAQPQQAAFASAAANTNATALALMQHAREADRRLMSSGSSTPTQAALKALAVAYLEACEAFLALAHCTADDKQELIVCSERAEQLDQLVGDWQRTGACPQGLRLQLQKKGGGGSGASAELNNLNLPAPPSSKPLVARPPTTAAALPAPVPLERKWGEVEPNPHRVPDNGEGRVLHTSSYIRVRSSVGSAQTSSDSDSGSSSSSSSGSGSGEGPEKERVLHFPRWIEGEDLLEDFSLPPGATPFTDPDGMLALSGNMRKARAEYQRPGQLLQTGGGATRHWRHVSVVHPRATATTATATAGAGVLAASTAGQPSTTAAVAPSLPVVDIVDAHSIKQGLVGDCSFVSSLIIAALHDRRIDMDIENAKKQGKATKRGRTARDRLVLPTLYPQDRATGLPIISANGKYLVKLFFNGTFRKVVIDDYLPCHAASQQMLCSTSIREGRLELWVSLIEKAYMKVHGGYNFQGSNSGTDLHSLTSWIPEQIFLPKGGQTSETADATTTVSRGVGCGLDHRQSLDRAWQRLLGGGQWGDTLSTVNTGPLTEAQEEETGLVREHAYAVLAVVEIVPSGERFLKVKNPWRNSPWKGRYSARDRSSWTPAMKAQLLPGIPATTNYNSEAAMQSMQRAWDDMEREGEFFIEFTDLLLYFGGNSILVNWNPEPFNHRKVVHESWQGSMGPQDDKFYIGENPQYSLLVNPPQKGEAPVSSAVWLLLSRHMTCTEGVGQEDDGTDAFMAMHVYNNTGGHRIYENTTTTPFIKGAYTNSRHSLVRINIDPQVTGAGAGAGAQSANVGSSAANQFTIVLSQSDRAPNKHITYSLSVYGAIYKYRFHHAPAPGSVAGPLERSGTIGGNVAVPVPKSAPTLKASLAAPRGPPAGGPPGSMHYGLNPQWYMRMDGSDATDGYVTVHLEAFYSEDCSANLTVVEQPPASSGMKWLNADQQLDCCRLHSMPPTARNSKWCSDAHERENGSPGLSFYLLKSSHGYRRGYCHLPRLQLRAGTAYIIVLSSSHRQEPTNFCLRAFAPRKGSVRFFRDLPMPEGAPFQYHYKAPSVFLPEGHQGGKAPSKRYRKNNMLLLRTLTAASTTPSTTSGSTRSSSAAIGGLGVDEGFIKVRLEPSVPAGGQRPPAVNLAMFRWPLPASADKAADLAQGQQEPLTARSQCAVASSHGGVYVDSTVAVCGVMSGGGMVLVPSALDEAADSPEAAAYTLHIFSTVQLSTEWVLG